LWLIIYPAWSQQPTLSQPKRRRCNAPAFFNSAYRTNFTCRLPWRLADRKDDARMDHFRSLPGSRRPHCARRRHACPRPLAMEYDRILWFIERTSGLRFGASRARGLETVSTRAQVPVEGRTQRLMVNRRVSRGRTLGIDPYCFICMELLYVRPSA